MNARDPVVADLAHHLSGLDEADRRDGFIEQFAAHAFDDPADLIDYLVDAVDAGGAAGRLLVRAVEGSPELMALLRPLIERAAGRAWIAGNDEAAEVAAARYFDSLEA